MVSKDLGAYRVLSPLGRGGMAAVYLAEHRQLGHRVAIKVLSPEHVDKGVFAERFLNEARAIAKLRHPAIVELVDFGRDDKAVYFVMEHLQGESLSRRLAEGPLGERAAAHFGRQIAGALDHAHEAGIVHRDLKPGNIFLVRDKEVPMGERVKVLDFGVAKQILEDTLSGEGRDLTGVGMLVGTPAYMSPEQCLDGRSVDHRSDIYSLGVLLYRMVTGTLPFESDDTDVLVDGHTSLLPDPPNRRNPQVSARMSETILRCLAKDPEQRFESMGELAKELEVLADGGSPSTELPPKPAHPPLPLPAPDDTRETQRKGVTVDLDENLPTVVDEVDDIDDVDDSIETLIANTDGSLTQVDLPEVPPSALLTPRRLRRAAVAGALALGCVALLIMLLGGGQESASAGAPSIQVRKVESSGYLERSRAAAAEALAEEEGDDSGEALEDAPSTEEVAALLEELAVDEDDSDAVADAAADGAANAEGPPSLVVEPEAGMEITTAEPSTRPAAPKREVARSKPRRRSKPAPRRRTTKRAVASKSAKRSRSKKFDSVATPALF